MRLSAEGFLRIEPGKGFFVTTLDSVEVRELYPLVAGLEFAAIVSAIRLPDPAALDRLNNALEDCIGGPERRLEADARFHEALVSNCDNKRLLGLLANVKKAMRHSEYSYMRAGGRGPSSHMMKASVREHREIIGGIASGDAFRTAEAVAKHWLNGMTRLLTVIEADESGVPPSRGSAVRSRVVPKRPQRSRE